MEHPDYPGRDVGSVAKDARARSLSNGLLTICLWLVGAALLLMLLGII